MIHFALRLGNLKMVSACYMAQYLKCLERGNLLNLASKFYFTKNEF